jgi:DNA-directed RNA polymerase specialized sigma24 family protein
MTPEVFCTGVEKTRRLDRSYTWGPGSIVADFTFGDIDVVELLERLTRHAYTLYGCFPCPDFSPVMRGYGDSPEDLAKETITRFLDPEDATVKWPSKRGKPTKAALLGYLKETLTNDFLDRKRSKRYKTQVELPPVETDDENGITLDDLAVYWETPEAIAIRNQRYEQLLAYLSDEPDLHDLLTIQLSPDGYQAYTNQDRARLLDTTVDEIENRKKRLERRLLKFQRERSNGRDDG